MVESEGKANADTGFRKKLRKDVKVEFWVSRYLHSSTLLKDTFLAEFTSVLDPVSLRFKLPHTLYHTGDQLSPTAQRNPTSGKKGSPEQELFRKGIWDSLRFKEQTFTISKADHALSKSYNLGA